MLVKIDNAVGLINQTLKYVAAALLLFVAVLIAFDVIMRFIFNKPVIGIAEIVANGILIIAFLQLSYAVRIGGMLRSELLVNRVGKRGKAVLEAVTSALGMVLFSLIAWASWSPMMSAIRTLEFEGHASFQVPVWPVKVVIVSCAILAVLNYLILIAKAAGGEPEPTGSVVDL
ncbi:TRAP transporter small permease subunit [Hoeflea ulvae]|uniref:TRAP transporter small permease protein n=1 Tax=Hoeflea ulvae TaxID=2983764 RepID=A0ABT3Y9N7_9HYPH|nr:TRAP transporter small permease [Hoeflea ulvae]MCY0092601.1 TRAP transporter small permease [Hoeflea ulvae]